MLPNAGIKVEEERSRPPPALGPQPPRRQSTTPHAPDPGQLQLQLLLHLQPPIYLFFFLTAAAATATPPLPRPARQRQADGPRRRHDPVLPLRRLLAVLLRPRHRVHGVVLSGPEHDAGDADGRVGVRRRASAPCGEGGGGGGEGEASAGGAGGGAKERERVAAEAAAAAGPQPRRELVAAVPRRRRRAAHVPGRVPGHGEAARGRRLPLRRRRRWRAGTGRCGVGGRHGAVRGREGAPAAAAAAGAGGGKGEMAAAEGGGGSLHHLVAGEAAGAAHGHLQRRSWLARAEPRRQKRRLWHATMHCSKQ